MKLYIFERILAQAENLNAEQIKNYEKAYGKLLGVRINGKGTIVCQYDSKQKPMEELKVLQRTQKWKERNDIHS